MWVTTPNQISCTSTQDVRVIGNPNKALAAIHAITPGVRTVLLIFVLGVYHATGFTQSQNPGFSEPQVHIQQILSSTPARAEKEPVVLQATLQEIYQHLQFRPVWTSESKIRQVLAVLEESTEYGLQPRDYHLPAIKALLARIRQAPDPAVTAALDVLLSDGLVLYVHHRREGKVHPRDLYKEFNFERDHSGDLKPTELVQQAAAAEDLAAFINAKAPFGNYYEMLRQQLIAYQALAASGGWPSVPVGPTLRKNDRDRRVVAMRKRLQVTGELQSSASNGEDLFNEELKQAVMLFQSLHGLAADGLVGKQTVAAMNVGVDSRVKQLRVSLERLRWLEHNSDREFLVVNIAGFRLAYVKNQVIEWDTRVIVGTPYRTTPVFRSLMTYVEFNPTWTIPPTILREDTLPAIRKNPSYLAEKNISVIDRNGDKVDPSRIDWSSLGRSVPYTLRQEPGPDNALGLVKFIFPNAYSVYMHDTPHRLLFEQATRSYSSGCIRVEDPFKLVELVLPDRKDFSLAEVGEILASGRTRRVLLEKPLPVWLLYLTATPDASGRAQFFPDIYQRDPDVADWLDGPVRAELQ